MENKVYLLEVKLQKRNPETPQNLKCRKHSPKASLCSRAEGGVEEIGKKNFSNPAPKPGKRAWE